MQPFIRLVSGLLGLAPALLAQSFEWRPLETWPAARSLAAVAQGQAGARSFLFGGRPYSNDLWEFAAGSFTRLPVRGARPPARQGAALAFDERRERLVLFGGSGSGVFGDTWEYDFAAQQWTQTTAAVGSPGGSFAPEMVFEPTLGRCLLVRLQDVADFAAWTYDGVQWAPLPAAAEPPARVGGALTYDAARRRCVLFGGRTGTGSLRDTWTYDAAAGTWQPLAVGAPAGDWSEAQLCFDPDRELVVLHDPGAPERCWTLGQGAWLACPPPLVAHPALERGSLLYDPLERQLAVFGGVRPGSPSGEDKAADLWTFEPVGRRWTGVLVDVPGNVFGGALATDPGTGRLQLLALDFRQQLRHWEWTGASWSALPGLGLPPLVAGFGMVGDAARGRLVLFGGRTAARQVYDTWEFDGRAWSRAAGSGPAVSDFAMAFDTARSRTLLCGGLQPSGRLSGETWVYEQGSWRSLAPALPLAPRREHAIAHDPLRDRIVLYGGRGLTGFDAATWEFDGRDWHEVATSSAPGPLTGHSLTWHADLGRVLLFGGTRLDGSLSDAAWTFDGAQWTRLTTADRPPPRSEHMAGYDPVRDELVLIGGRYLAGARTDTWGLGRRSPATIQYRGSRCFVGSRVPILRAVPGSLPALGTDLQLRCIGLSSAPAFGLLGVSNTMRAGVRLPLHLGATGCDLRTSAEDTIALASVAGVALWSIPVPDRPELLGAEFHVQCLSLEPGGTPLGVVPSNSADCRIGSR